MVQADFLVFGSLSSYPPPSLPPSFPLSGRSSREGSGQGGRRAACLPWEEEGGERARQGPRSREEETRSTLSSLPPSLPFVSASSSPSE